MTDYPRFQARRADPEHAFRGYHGARQVELVLRLADRWLQHRCTREVRAELHLHAKSKRSKETP